MKLGEKILKLRKENKYSQEALAEKMSVTRQTISNWELGETNPDIKQATQLSKIFNISLDELVENDIKDILVKKISNTERLAGITIKILRIIGITFIVLFLFYITAFILFKKQPKNSDVKLVTLNCSIKDKEFEVIIGNNSYFNCNNCDKKMEIYLRDITDWANIETSIKNVNTYFKENGGNCKKIQ